MAIKIGDMTPDDNITGVEIIPVTDGVTPKSVTVSGVKDFIIDQIEAISAASSTTGSDSIFIMQGGVLKPIDIDLIVGYALGVMWDKAAESAPDSADTMTINDGGTQKTVTLALMAEYVRATIEAAILDISDLAVIATATATDVMMIVQGSTAKQMTFANFSTAVYGALKDYVTALTAVSAGNDADVFYVIQGGVEKKVTLATIKSYLGNPATAPGTTTVGNVPQWSSTSGDLADGLDIVASVGSTGSDSNLSTEKAVRTAVSGAVYDQSAIAIDLADAHTVAVDLAGGSASQFKATFTAIWTWIMSKLSTLDTVTGVGTDFVIISDTSDSGLAKKVLMSELGVAGGGISWSTIAANTTATTGNGYMIDAGAGTVTLTLPAAPSVGDLVSFKCFDATNTVTIDRNGLNIEGAASDITLVADEAYTLAYSEATEGWVKTDFYQAGIEQGVFAFMPVDTNTTTCTAADTWYPIAGTFTNSPMQDFSLGTLTIDYDGLETKQFKIDWSASCSGDSSSMTIHIGVKKNGTILPGSIMGTFLKTVDEPQALGGTVVVELETGDTIQLVIMADGAGDIVSTKHFTTAVNGFYVDSSNAGAGSGMNWVSVPASNSASGTRSQMAYASNYLYVCVATDTWIRSAAESSF